jgi:multidrug resistance efflux pump
MMAAEMEDAFRVRKWVIVILLGVGLIGVYGVVWVMSWVKYVWTNWAEIGTSSPPTVYNPGPKPIMYGEL